MPLKSKLFPPMSWQECLDRGWDSIDVLLVTGDAYVDHPSFGIAIIYRLLESLGLKVALLSQPRYNDPSAFKAYPNPKLFCGITAGNLDSIVANYTSSGKVRNSDNYSPDGNPWHDGDKNRKRPDRASIIYTSLARAAFDCPIILGGVEASLRRFCHYDYKQNKLRASILTDAKADLVVYGMGEKAMTEIATRCLAGHDLSGIPGTCQRLTDKQLTETFPDFQDPANTKQYLSLASFKDIQEDKKKFLVAEVAIDSHARANSQQIILQRQQAQWLIQYPAYTPLKGEKLDDIYAYPYTRTTHKSQPRVPALNMIKDSVTIVRGCSGNCAFCAITRHQGAEISSRSHQSIIKECQELIKDKKFSGTISDLGGPTANLYGTSCKIGGCRKRDCLYPKVCSNLEYDEAGFLKLLDKVESIEEVKHLFISSGLRMELLLKTPKLMERIIKKHTPGALQVAPEHTNAEVLALMHKEGHDLLIRFIERCKEIAKKIGKPVYVNPYIITAHPGSTLKHAKCLTKDLQKLGLKARAFQDFTPTPGSISTAMYVAEHDLENKPLFVPKKPADKVAQRKIVESEILLANPKHGKKKKKKKTAPANKFKKNKNSFKK